MSYVLLRGILLHREKLFLSAVEIIFVAVPVYDFFFQMVGTGTAVKAVTMSTLSVL